MARSLLVRRPFPAGTASARDLSSALGCAQRDQIRREADTAFTAAGALEKADRKGKFLTYPIFPSLTKIGRGNQIGRL
jgi:hypothetical protein